MKFTIFQSDKGDCLLLESDDGYLILADGGMSSSYREHVAPALGKLREAGRGIDLIYVSHIDQDHISGILRLADDLVAWRVYDYQVGAGNTKARPPKFPRPPEIKEIWHNAFHEQLGKNTGPISKMLAASHQVLSAARSDDLLEIAEEHGELALSQMEAMRLSRRINAKQLGIPLNPPSQGRLLYARAAMQPIVQGALSIYVIGPFEADLKILRDLWNEWLEANQDDLDKLRKRSAKDEDDLGTGGLSLIREMEVDARAFGLRKNVTAPNLASLMLLIEERKQNGQLKTYLMTGDGHASDILKGLAAHGKLNQQNHQSMHVDVLKFPHHGSENNVDLAFLQAVTADHYVFCGNGEHENPDIGVVQMVLESRVGALAKRSKNAETNNGFTVWFSSAADVPADADAQAHMVKLEKLMKAAHERNPKIKPVFLNRSKTSFSL